MTAIVTPPIGLKGVFVLAPPFDRFVNAGEEYSCMAIRRLSDYLASNEQPDTSIYKTYGIEDRYAEDLKNDTYIVSLQSRRGHWVYVPAQYVKSFPSGSGYRYRSVSLVFSLPAIPNDTNFDTIQADVISLIKSQLGVDAKSRIVETSLTTLVSDAKHIEVSTKRALSKTSNGTWEEINLVREQNEVLRHKLAELEAYIIAHP